MICEKYKSITGCNASNPGAQSLSQPACDIANFCVYKSHQVRTMGTAEAMYVCHASTKGMIITLQQVETGTVNM